MTINITDFINKIMHNNFNKNENEKIIKYFNKQFTVFTEKNNKYSGIVIDNRGDKPIIYNNLGIAYSSLSK